jgi:FkbM family methyltransferase
VKLRVLGALLAISVLTIAAIARLNPSSLVLLARDVKLRSPYCSVWKASIDGRIKLRQQSVADEIAQSSRLVRREAGLVLWATPKGRFWIPEGDDRILPLLLAQEDRDIYGSGDWGVQRGDLVLDVGAYIGTWTKYALARGASRVIAIEPSPASVECLRRNLSDDVAAGRVIIYPKGIWDFEGALTLFANSGTGVGNSFVEANSAAQAINSIPVTTIDTLAAELKLKHVNFIKADVKGATERLLRGAAVTLRRDRPRLAFSTEEPADDVAGILKAAQRIQPAYDYQCGPCLLDGKDIYTDVLFLR